MVSHAGQRISCYDIAEIFGSAYTKVATPEKAINGFRVSGLWPYNDQVFKEEDFAPAQLTDEPEAAANNETNNVVNNQENDTNNQANNGANNQGNVTNNETNNNQANNNKENNKPTQLNNEPVPSTSVAGELIELLNLRTPKATPITRKRKAESAAVLTSSPYKKCLTEKQQGKESKGKGNKKIVKKKKLAPKKNDRSKKAKTKKGKGKTVKEDEASESDSDSDWPCLVCGETFNSSKPGEKWIQCHSLP